MAASRWQHPKLPHQSAACACTEFPHLGMTVKHSDPQVLSTYIYIPWVATISITYTYLQVTGFQGGNYFSSLADCSLHPKSLCKGQMGYGAGHTHTCNKPQPKTHIFPLQLASYSALSMAVWIFPCLRPHISFPN